MLPMLASAAIGWFVGDLWILDGTFFVGSIILGAIMGLFVAFIIGEGHKDETITIVQLAALQTSDAISGSFFLGCGQIGTTPYYVYYKKLEDGGYQYRRKEADTDAVSVYEEERRNGVLEEYSYRPPIWMWVWLAFWEDKMVYKFRIPNGSIRKEFTL